MTIAAVIPLETAETLVVVPTSSSSLLLPNHEDGAQLLDAKSAEEEETVTLVAVAVDEPSTSSSWGSLADAKRDYASMTRTVADSDDDGDDNDDAATWSRLPAEVLCRIFRQLDMPERRDAALVCVRWHHILTSGVAPLDDVFVLNVFEERVWRESVQRNSEGGPRVRPWQLTTTVDEIRHVFAHCRRVGNLKLWFRSNATACRVLEIVVSMGVRVGAVDLYPYDPLEARVLAAVDRTGCTGVTMRPHGAAYFMAGMPAPHPATGWPPFRALSALVLDSFTLPAGGAALLPSGLKSLEFAHRNREQLAPVCAALAELPQLEYLALSSLYFSGVSELRDLLFLLHVDRMPRLFCLIFRYCKFPAGVVAPDPPNESAENARQQPPKMLNRLGAVLTNESGEKLQLGVKLFKVELCRDDWMLALDAIMETSSALASVVLNITTCEYEVAELMRVARKLLARKIWLTASLLSGKSAAPVVAECVQHPGCVGPNWPWNDEFATVCRKLEASFIIEPGLLDRILGRKDQVSLRFVNEVKFIKCSSLTDAHLKHMAEFFPCIRQLTIVNCSEVTEDGVLEFLRHWSRRLAQSLTITWKRELRQPKLHKLYLIMATEHHGLLQGLGTRLFTKTFDHDVDSEEILIWEKRAPKRQLIIRDYSDYDLGRKLGVIVPALPQERFPTTSV